MSRPWKGTLFVTLPYLFSKGKIIRGGGGKHPHPPSILDKNSPIGIKQHFCSDFYNFSYLLLVVVRLIRYEMQIFFLIRNSVIFLKENIKYKKRPGVLNKKLYFPGLGLCLVSWLRSLCYPWSAEDLDIY